MDVIMSCLSCRCVFPVVSQFIDPPLWQPVMVVPDRLCQVIGIPGRSLAGIFLLLLWGACRKGEADLPDTSRAAWEKKRNDQVLDSLLQLTVKQGQHW